MFKPTTLLDKFYEAGIILKGVDGLLELVAGIALLSVQPGTILDLTHTVTHTELSEDPHDFIATHVLHVGTQLAHGHSAFVAAFLLIHGAVKVGLVVCLLLNKPWAYPIGIVVLGLFLLYQLYQLAIGPTFGMAFLSALDVAIIWLVWREWQHVRSGERRRFAKAGDTPEGDD